MKRLGTDQQFRIRISPAVLRFPTMNRGVSRCSGHRSWMAVFRFSPAPRSDLERYLFLWNRDLLLARWMGPRTPIAVCSRIQELKPVDVNEIPVILCARFLVLPGFGTLAAFQIHAAALVEVFAGDFSSPSERLYAEPLGALLEFTILVLPAFGTGDRELRNDRSLWTVLQLRIAAEIADYQNFLHRGLLN